MFERGHAWCEENCGKVADSVCWKKLFELKLEEKKLWL
jgi:hypothetical protein